MGIGSENDPFQRIIDASWQDADAQYMPTEESYNDDWPEDQNGSVLLRVAYRPIGYPGYPNRRNTHTCIPPRRTLEMILQGINEHKTIHGDKTAAVPAPRAGVRADAHTIEIDDNPTTPEGFYDFTDYRTGHTD